jgi:hypothetical protein
VIIDAGHRNWFFGTALAGVVTLALFAWSDRATPGGASGGTTAGLWFGIVGTGLMVFCGLLAALRRVPSWWWLGSRQFWLKGHIWLGSLSVLMILCHSGFRFGGGLERLLWIVFAVIIVSGFVGLILQQVLPSVISRRVPNEVSFEQLPHYCDVLKCRADGFADGIAVLLPDEVPEMSGAAFTQVYDEQLRPFFAAESSRSPLNEKTLGGWFGRLRELFQLPAQADAETEISKLLTDLRDRAGPDKKKEVEALKSTWSKLVEADEPERLAVAAKAASTALHSVAATINASDRAIGIERLCAASWLDRLELLSQERAQFRTQELLHRWLHGWLLIHVPLSAALLALTVAHIIMSLYY